MKLCTTVQEGCGYKDTLHVHRYYAPLAKYFTVCITYQPTLVHALKLRNVVIIYISGMLNVIVMKFKIYFITIPFDSTWMHWTKEMFENQDGNTMDS